MITVHDDPPTLPLIEEDPLLGLRSLGTLGYDAYAQWVLNNEEMEWSNRMSDQTKLKEALEACAKLGCLHVLRDRWMRGGGMARPACGKCQTCKAREVVNGLSNGHSRATVREGFAR